MKNSNALLVTGFCAALVALDKTDLLIPQDIDNALNESSALEGMSQDTECTPSQVSSCQNSTRWLLTHATMLQDAFQEICAQVPDCMNSIPSQDIDFSHYFGELQSLPVRCAQANQSNERVAQLAAYHHSTTKEDFSRIQIFPVLWRIHESKPCSLTATLAHESFHTDFDHPTTPDGQLVSSSDWLYTLGRAVYTSCASDLSPSLH